jgi:hypothetical protein
MTLGSIQPLTEISTMNLPWGGGVKGGRRVRLSTSVSSVSRFSIKMWEPRRLIALWASTACYRVSFTFNLAFMHYSHAAYINNTSKLKKIILLITVFWVHVHVAEIFSQ